MDPTNIKPIMQLLSIATVAVRSQPLSGLSKLKYHISVKDARLSIPKELVAAGAGLQHCVTTISSLSLYL